MTELSNPVEVMNKLREAENMLNLASEAAIETEGDTTHLQGETAVLIGGLSQAAGSLAGLIEDSAAARVAGKTPKENQ